MSFSKPVLDWLGTIFGISGMVAGVLTAQGVGDPKITGSISGICTGLLGYVVQKPATAHPTTEDLEEGDSNG